MEWHYLFIILTLLTQAAPPAAPPADHVLPPTVVVTTTALLTSALSSPVVSPQTPLAPPLSCAPCPRPSCTPCAVSAPVNVTDRPSPSPAAKAADPPTTRIAGNITLACAVVTLGNVFGKSVLLLLLNLAAKYWSGAAWFREMLADLTEGLDQTLQEGRVAKVSELEKQVKQLTAQNEDLKAQVKQLTELDELDTILDDFTCSPGAAGS